MYYVSHSSSNRFFIQTGSYKPASTDNYTDWGFTNDANYLQHYFIINWDITNVTVWVSFLMNNFVSHKGEKASLINQNTLLDNSEVAACCLLHSVNLNFGSNLPIHIKIVKFPYFRGVFFVTGPPPDAMHSHHSECTNLTGVVLLACQPFF